MGTLRKQAMPKKTDGAIFQLKIRGPGVRSGRVSVPDLIKICQEAQTAVRRQAEALEGKKTMHPGPASSSIKHECTLELIGLRKGSTTLQFGLARPQMDLPFEEYGSFGAEVVRELAQTIKSLTNGHKKKDIDEGVLRSLYNLGSAVVDNRIDEIQWIAPRHGQQKKVSASLQKPTREKIATRLSQPKKGQVHVDGILEMADFKPADRKCRIDPAIGIPITCTFEADQEEKIYASLRKPVRVSGEAIFQPFNRRIEMVHIGSIEPLQSLAIGEENFFASASLEDLAAAQAIEPMKDVSVLCGGFPADENIDEFLDEIYNARG